MKNFSFVLVCFLLLFSTLSFAQEETERDAEEVEVQVQDGEEPQPDADGILDEEPSEPVPIDPVENGELFMFY